MQCAINVDGSLKLNVPQTKEEDISHLEEVIKSGFTNLDVGIGMLPGAPFLTGKRREWVNRIAEAAAVNNVHIVQCHAPIYGRQTYTDGHWKIELGDEHKDAFHALFDTAEIWGVENLVFHPYDLNLKSDNAGPAAREDMNYEYFSYAAELAEKHNTHIAIENMIKRTPESYCAESGELIRLADRIGSGVCFDTGHAHMSGFSVSDYTRVLGPRLKALHVHDNNGASDQHLLPLFGNIRWPDFIGALKEINYGGYFTFEISSFYVEKMILPARFAFYKLAFEIFNGLSAKDTSPKP